MGNLLNTTATSLPKYGVGGVVKAKRGEALPTLIGWEAPWRFQRESLVNGEPAALGEIILTFPLDAKQPQTAKKLCTNNICYSEHTQLYFINLSFKFIYTFFLKSCILVYFLSNRAPISKEEFRSSFLTHKRLNPVNRGPPLVPHIWFRFRNMIIGKWRVLPSWERERKLLWHNHN